MLEQRRRDRARTIGPRKIFQLEGVSRIAAKAAVGQRVGDGASSTSEPRAGLISSAPGFIKASRSASSKCSVPADSGKHSTTMLASASSAASVGASRRGSRPLRALVTKKNAAIEAGKALCHRAPDGSQAEETDGAVLDRDAIKARRPAGESPAAYVAVGGAHMARSPIIRPTASSAVGAVSRSGTMLTRRRAWCTPRHRYCRSP